MALAPAPEPKSALGRKRILSPTAALRVSPLCLGAMSLGGAWGEGLGHITKEDGFKLLDTFYDLGGNFIDTANNYHNGESEQWIGEWMESKGNRDEMVIATKFSSMYDPSKFDRSNLNGNSYKSMFVSVENSLKKLKTSYIDLLYIHWWDWTTSVPELMQGLNNLVKAGKVLYIGVSDTPAWVVTKCNQYARDHGLAQFVVYQGKWSIAERDFERDILDMVRSEGMGLAPWNAMGGGMFQTKKQLEEREKAGEKLRAFYGGKQSETHEKISAALEKVAGEVGVSSITAIALAYVMSKAPYVFPLVGGRKIEHLKENIEALNIKLSSKQIEELEGVVPFDVGFPKSMIMADPHLTQELGWLAKMGGAVDFVQAPVSLHHQP